MMSTVAYGDFNNDGRVDKAAITAPTTIFNGGWYVHSWLGKGDGSFEARKTNRFTFPPHGGHGGTW